MSIDLHIHSSFSDGSMSPTELVQYAQRLHLTALSITDHDTIEGVGEAMTAGKQFGIEVISGLELSIKFGECAVHLLGYMFQPTDKGLLSALHRLQVGRIERNKAILDNLCRLGIDIADAELQKKSGHGQCGRPHFAQLLMHKGIVGSMDEAFDKYLARGGLAYVPRTVFQADEAIAMVKNAGGIAVLAHPQQLEKSGNDVTLIIGKLRAIGLDGIEVYYPNHSRQFKKKLLAIARKQNLLITGGSDYHGTIRPGTTLAGGSNCSVPPELLQQMKKYLEKKQGILESAEICRREIP